jgi:hypothetical protein
LRNWYLTTSPLVTANWEADEDNRWTVPIRWAASQKDDPSRAEAIRRLAELGLANAQRTAAAKASEMAGQEIDRKLK